MRKANEDMMSKVIEKRLAETKMSEYKRHRALELLRDAEAIAEAIVWVKQRVASLGAYFLKPGFKN